MGPYRRSTSKGPRVAAVLALEISIIFTMRRMLSPVVAFWLPRNITKNPRRPVPTRMPKDLAG
jgi:hypothetical protein